MAITANTCSSLAMSLLILLCAKKASAIEFFWQHLNSKSILIPKAQKHPKKSFLEGTSHSCEFSLPAKQSAKNEATHLKVLILNKVEYQLFSDLHLYGVLSPHFSEILKGAHIWIADQGKLYQKWVAYKGAKARVSSHPTDLQEHSISGPFVREFLFGQIKDDQDQVYTWFQLERTPFSDQFKDKLLHAYDYLLYLATWKQKQVGPYGYSKYTDQNPILIKEAQIYKSRSAKRRLIQRNNAAKYKAPSIHQQMECENFNIWEHLKD